MASTVRRLKRIVRLPIDGGVDAGNEPRLSKDPIIVENGIYDRNGVISKRTGVTAGTSITSGAAKLFDADGDILLTGGETFSSYAIQNDTERTIDSDGARLYTTTVIPRDSTIRGASSKDTPLGCDTVGVTNYTAVAFIRHGTPKTATIKTFDAVTNALISSLDVTNINAIRLLRISGSAVKIYSQNASTNVITRRNIDSAGVIAGTATTFFSNVDAARIFDACWVTSGDFVAVLYYDTSAATLKLTFLPSGETASSVTANIASTVHANSPLAVFTNNNDDEATAVWVEASGATRNVRAIAYDTTGASAITVGTVYTYNTANFGESTNGLPEVMAGIYQVYSDGDDATLYVTAPNQADSSSNSAYSTIEVNMNQTAGAYSNSSTKEYHRMKLATKPVEQGASDWVLGVYAEAWSPSGSTETKSSQHSYFWLTNGDAKATGLRVVGKTRLGLAYNASNSTIFATQLPGGNVGITRAWALPAFLRVEFRKWFRQLVEVFEVFTVALTLDDNQITSTTKSGLTQIGGALGYEYDRVNLFEQGFLMFPEPLIAAQIAGSNLADGTYLFKATYEYTDAAGNRHQSAPTTEGVSLTISSGPAAARITVPTLTMTRRSDVKIVIWRTDVNETIYSRVAVADNDTTVSFITVDDDTAFDGTFEQLYTTGGVLENIQPPPHVVSTIWQDRHVLVDSESGNLGYSTVPVPGVPFEHNEALALQLEARGGDTKALAVLSDKLVIFKESAVYVTEGAGLNSIGGGTNFLNPYLVSSNVGCKNSRSIATIPQGIMFQADDGIWLLDRSFQLQKIGDRMHYYVNDASLGDVTGTAVINDKNYVILTTASTALVYNWLRGKWSTFTQHGAVSALSVSNVAYWIASGNLLKASKTDGSYADGAAGFIGMKVRTPWIASGDVGGWFRLSEIVLVMHNVDNHSLNVEIGYNGEPSWVDELTFAAVATDEFDYTDYFGPMNQDSLRDKAYMLKIQPSRAKCSSFMLEVSDSQSSGQTAGYDISAVLLAIKQKIDTIHIDAARFVTS